MKKNSEKLLQKLLRIVSAVLIVVIAGFILITYLISGTNTRSKELYTENDFVYDASEIQFKDSETVLMNGKWEYYPGVFFEKEGYDPNLLSNPESINLPISNITETADQATYRAYLTQFSLPDDELVFYIEIPRSTIQIFVDGVLLEQKNTETVGLNALINKSVFYMKNLDAAKSTHEIVISVKENSNGSGIYKRAIMISTLSAAMSYSFWKVGSEMLLLGIIILIMISGYVFMFFCPNHKMISWMTIFDTTLMLRLVVNLNYAMAFYESVFPAFKPTDHGALSNQLFYLMMGGISGILLSSNIYDPDRKTPKLLTYPPSIAFIICGVVFPLNLELFDKVGIPIILGVFLYTFIGVFYQYYICLKARRNSYYYIQIAKTSYVGLLVLIDILTIKSNFPFLMLVQLYCIFFIIHVGFRLYDNNRSYQEVEVLNQTLESTVEERTKELESANKILSELSIRDSLTNAYNRLYFEQTIELLLKEESQVPCFYMALFDLDFFKKINDKYGHDQGDQQLREVTKSVNELLPEHCVFSRIGGEEFTVIFTEMDAKLVLFYAESLRHQFEQNSKKNPMYTTISMGITKYQPNDTSREILRRVDLCLYLAKNNGRNRIYHDLDGEQKELLSITQN